MAVVSIPDERREIVDPAEIAAFLEPFGIWYEKWDVAGRITDGASHEEILAAYKPEIDRLNARGGFVTADVIDVNPDTPGLDAMLDKFKVEHTHDEDEVRFVVDGSGIFHVNPVSAPVFSVEMQAGDLINVPRGTQHWFNLCQEKSIKTIRLFQDPGGWTPFYIEESAHIRYEPLCFGPSYLPRDKESVSKERVGKELAGKEKE